MSNTNNNIGYNNCGLKYDELSLDCGLNYTREKEVTLLDYIDKHCANCPYMYEVCMWGED